MTDILKLLSKPSKFTGEEKDWKPWNFSFMAYVGAVDKIMAAEAVTAMKSKVQVNMVDITTEQQQRSATMFSLLVQLYLLACGLARPAPRTRRKKRRAEKKALVEHSFENCTTELRFQVDFGGHFVHGSGALVESDL